MADDLGRLMNSLEGEGPSPEFVASLRERIVAETSSGAAGADPVATAVTADGAALGRQPLVEIDLPPKPEEPAMTPKRWGLVALAAAVIVVIAIALNAGGDEGLIDTIDPADSTSLPANETTTTQANRAATPSAEPATFDAEAAPYGEDLTTMEPGTYRVDTLGTPFSFTADGPLFIVSNSGGEFFLTHPNGTSPGDRELAFLRVSKLSDPAQMNERFTSLDDGWPTDDLAGWLDALPDEITVSGVEETTLGGFPATRFDLELGDVDCGPGVDFCLDFATNHGATGQSFIARTLNRIWFVDQGDEDPIVVMISITNKTNDEWFAEAEQILSTLAFGDIAPNPVVSTPAGRAEVTLLGGIDIEFTEEVVVDQDLQDYAHIRLGGQIAGTLFLTNPLDADREPIPTSDEFLALFEERNSVLTELDQVAVGGIEARVFDVSGGGTTPEIFMGPDDEGGLSTGPLGRMWLIDHPERGLLVVYAYSLNESPFTLVIARTEQMLDSLQYVDLN